MTALDQQRTCRPPTQWTGELVKSRLVEAFRTERQMPEQRFLTIASAWPATPMHSFTDMLHWNNDRDGARDRVWKDWARPKNVFSWQVSRMDEAIDWLCWLDVGERRCLAAWSVGKANRKTERAIIKAGGWAPTSFYRAVKKAADRIAERLNQQRVAVR